MESSAPAVRSSSTSTATESATGKRPAVDPATPSSCKRLRQGEGSSPRANPPSGGSLASAVSSLPSPHATIAITVGGVLSVSPATPCLAVITTESMVVTTIVVSSRDGETGSSSLPLPDRKWKEAFKSTAMEVKGGESASGF
ncbi:hypothetical protein E2562_013716 [Oryza meyeriana var. granulata]|uniref:Uncharacterized protein n=1 Tax=Oryza meyeriana var. granulata TaxID=110450 RepID=A0A6G1BJZ6_9ORYZ|nr:hypothetical protein E2562_013716 [Oryza meyeriana var. granulata]